MGLNKSQLELYFAFTGRHKRFLKLRETSFNIKQLEDGVSITEKAVKAVQAACKNFELPIAECLAKPAKRSALIREMRKKAPRITPKEAAFILEHFESFQLAVSTAQAPVSVKISKKPSEYGDKYYQPTQHKYR
ncbi:MAG: hypothetical protein V1722_03090 [Candidatus Micrarchaeota archaeon]